MVRHLIFAYQHPGNRQADFQIEAQKFSSRKNNFAVRLIFPASSTCAKKKEIQLFFHIFNES